MEEILLFYQRDRALKQELQNQDIERFNKTLEKFRANLGQFRCDCDLNLFMDKHINDRFQSIRLKIHIEGVDKAKPCSITFRVPTGLNIDIEDILQGNATVLEAFAYPAKRGDRTQFYDLVIILKRVTKHVFEDAPILTITQDEYTTFAPPDDIRIYMDRDTAVRAVFRTDYIEENKFLDKEIEISETFTKMRYARISVKASAKVGRTYKVKESLLEIVGDKQAKKNYEDNCTTFF